MHTNIEELNKIIDSSGLKISYLAEKCGLTRAGFYKKRTGQSEWTASEIAVLRTELKLSLKQLDNIFLR